MRWALGLPSDAVDRGRTGLVRGGIRTSTVDHLRHAADPSVGIDAAARLGLGSLAGFVLFYTVLLIAEMYLMVKYARLGPSSLGTGPFETANRATPYQPERTIMFDYPTLRVIWWILIGVLLIGFAIMDGHDMGVATLLPFIGKTDGDRRVMHQHRRPALGRQPGLVHHRRRRDFRRLALCLRNGVFRLLLGDAGGALGACSSARSASTTAANWKTRAGAASGTGVCSSAVSYRR